MKTLRAAIRRIAGGPAASRLLGRFGINAKKFWLLMDLFEQVAVRREFMGQLGRDEFSMKMAAGFLAVLSAFFAVLALVTQVPVTFLLINSAVMTVFVVLLYSLGEASNSLVNPSEALILAHQPIDGATYTAAKLGHLLRLLVYLVLAVNATPAVAGLGLKGAAWTYPVEHLSITFAIGLLVVLFVCALYGWVVRYARAERLKTISQVSDLLLVGGLVAFGPAWRGLTRFFEAHSFTLEPSVKMSLSGALGLAALVFLVFGLRSLRGDYLIKVSSIARGRSDVKTKARASWLGAIVARVCGGAAARAGFEYTRRLMRRDWMFLKQLLICVYLLIMLLTLLVRDVAKSPFAPQFSGVHVFPHALGICAFFVCMMMPYGGDHKSAWVFQIVAPRVFDSFARGVHGVLLLVFAVMPHLILLPVIWWYWGWWQALLFTAYSAALVSLYLAAEIRLIERVPFSAQLDPKRNALMMPLMFGGGFGIAIVVALQYFVVFRMTLTVAAVAAIVGLAAWFLTKVSTRTLADDMRFQLSIESNEIGTVYVEL